MEYIVGDESKEDHHSVDQVLRGWAAVFLPAHGRNDEEDREPDDELVAHEHAGRTQQQGNETGAVWLLLHQQPGWVEVLHIV